MKVLLFDIEITGHHLDFINNLIPELNKYELNNFIFITHYDISIKTYKNITIQNISKDEYFSLKNKNLLIKYYNLNKILNKYSQIYNSNKILFLYLDQFQYLFLLFNLKIEIYGILFSNFYRIPVNSFHNLFRFFHKYLIFHLLINSSKIKKIFILNDIEVVDYLSNKYKTRKIVYLPDPISLELNNLTSNFDVKELIPDYSVDKKIFLHIGSLSKRKGTLKLIKAIEKLNKVEQLNCIFLIVGKSDEKFNKIIREKLYSIKHRKPYLNIFYKNEFIDEQYFNYLIIYSNYLLLPYDKNELSSGLFVKALYLNKHIIITQNGLLNFIATKYNFNCTFIENNSINNILDSIKSVIENTFEPNISLNLKFKEDHSFYLFTKILSSNIH